MHIRLTRFGAMLLILLAFAVSANADNVSVDADNASVDADSAVIKCQDTGVFKCDDASLATCNNSYAYWSGHHSQGYNCMLEGNRCVQTGGKLCVK